MCEICRTSPCVSRCPNYVPRKTRTYCAVCGDGIYGGEEYIENNDGECMHVDCIQSIGQLLDWLGCDVKVRDDEDDGGSWFGNFWED